MLVSDVISRVRNTAGDTNVMQFTDSMLFQWINDGIRECAVDNNLLQKRATSTVVSGTEAYSLPTDILKIHSVKYDGAKLQLFTLQQFESYIGDRSPSTNAEKGTPAVCYIWANQLYLSPAPDNSASKLVIEYIYDPPLLTVAGDDLKTSLPVGYHTRIVDYCLAQVAQQDDDMERYQIKLEEFRTGVSKLKDQPETQEDLYPSMSTSPRDMGEGGFEW